MFYSLHSWTFKIGSKAHVRRASSANRRQSQHRAQIGVEVLEDRCLLSLFGAPVNYPVGTIPSSVAAGDFMGNGHLDLAVANSFDNTVTILLNNGRGTFIPEAPIHVGNDPVALAVGDFTGNGRLDLAVANHGDDDVMVLLNQGNGTFKRTATIKVAAYPVSIAVGDLNGDGKLDLAVACDVDGEVDELFNTGAGTFKNAQIVPITTGVLTSVAVGDFFGDGNNELAVTDAVNNEVLVLPTQGKISIISVGQLPSSMAAGDFTGDGTLDLAVANANSNSVSVLINNGQGNFANAVNYPVGDQPASVAVGDFTGDGSLDLAVANAGSDNVTVLYNNGHGIFDQSVNYPVDLNPVSVATGDFNGDGFDDLAVANYTTDDVSVLLDQANRLTTTQLSASPLEAVSGQLVTYTATISNSDPLLPVPTGTVTFSTGSTVLGTGVLDANGQATLSTRGTPTGVEFVTATYQGDEFYDGSSSSLEELVNLDSTATSLTSSVNPALVSDSVTFSATVAAVAPGSGTPTGAVLFEDGGHGLGYGTLEDGVASFTVAGLTAGNHSVSAVYLGDGNFTRSTARLTEKVFQDETRLSLSSSKNPAFVGDSVTFSASVASAPGTGTPTGTVVFEEEEARFGKGSPGVRTVVLGRATLVEGVASITTATLAASSQTISAIYLGNNEFSGSSAKLKEVLLLNATTTSLSSSENPAFPGESVTFSVSVAPVASGIRPPAGIVQFDDGNAVLGNATLKDGVATFTTTALTEGSHTISALYQGDAKFAVSTASLLETITRGTSVSVSGPASAVYGQIVTYTAIVSKLDTSEGAPTGIVTFFDGGTILGTGTVDANGEATITTVVSSVGDHAITAIYEGDSTFGPSTSPAFNEPVLQDATVVTVTAAPNPINLGSSVTVTVTITPAVPGSGQPTGLVALLDGSNIIAFVNATAAGNMGNSTPVGTTVMFTVPNLPAGDNTLSVEYLGDQNFLSSTSAPLLVVVNQPGANEG